MVELPLKLLELLLRFLFDPANLPLLVLSKLVLEALYLKVDILLDLVPDLPFLVFLVLFPFLFLPRDLLLVLANKLLLFEEEISVNFLD